MKRRAFLSSLFAAMAVSHAKGTLAETSGQKVLAAIAPYAAATLEDTDPELFRISMIQQMQANGIRLPTRYVPFQTDTSRPASTNPNSNTVYGDPLKNGFLDGSREVLTNYFNGQPPCSSLVLSKSPMAARVFTALHETTHHVAANFIVGGLDLNDDVFNSINKISGQKAQSYFETLEIKANRMVPMGRHQTLGSIQQNSLFRDEALWTAVYDAQFSAFLVALVFLPQTRERIADTGAALYILSNYGATPKNDAFLKDIIDLRIATFDDIYMHDTVSSLKRAINVFSEHPAHGLSIVQTAFWAAEIIKYQPEFTQGIEGIATDIRNRLDAEVTFVPRVSKRWRPSNYSEATAESWKVRANSILDARSRACQLATVVR